jgi:hypothetical protein
MTEPSRAVFLSYASQDAEEAGRICIALRAAGIEVWFDQSELRGGDAWDQLIRRQIRDCALFVPIISAPHADSHRRLFSAGMAPRGPTQITDDQEPTIPGTSMYRRYIGGGRRGSGLLQCRAMDAAARRPDDDRLCGSDIGPAVTQAATCSNCEQILRRSGCTRYDGIASFYPCARGATAGSVPHHDAGLHRSWLRRVRQVYRVQTPASRRQRRGLGAHADSGPGKVRRGAAFRRHEREKGPRVLLRRTVRGTH